jgi:hypothetical protein
MSRNADHQGRGVGGYDVIAAKLNRFESLQAKQLSRGEGGLNPWGRRGPLPHGPHAQIFLEPGLLIIFSEIKEFKEGLVEPLNAFRNQSTACAAQRRSERARRTRRPELFSAPHGSAARRLAPTRRGLKSLWPWGTATASRAHGQFREIPESFFWQGFRLHSSAGDRRTENRRVIQGGGVGRCTHGVGLEKTTRGNR